MPVRLVSDSDIPAEFRGMEPEWWREKMLTDLFFLCSVVLRHGKTREYRDMNWIHLKLCDFLDPRKNPVDQLLVLMFRDALKSSVARGLVIQWFLENLYFKREAKAFIYSGKFELAQDHADRIVKELIGNRLIQAFFGDFVPRGRSDFETCAIDQGKVRYKNVELDIGSPEKSLTGHHYDLGINDNLVNEVNSDTTEGRRKTTKRWMQQEAILAENAREIVFETTWWPDDVAGHILDPEHKFDFRKLYRKPCHTFLSDTGYMVFSCPATAGGGKLGVPVFPEKVDEAYLKRKRSKMTAALYFSLYELQPTADEDIEYERAWLSYYDEPPKNYIRKMVIDCSGTLGKESTPTAISIGDWDQEGAFNVAYAKKQKLTPMDVIEWIEALWQNCIEEGRPIWEIGAEKEKYGIFLGDYMSVKHPDWPITLIDIKGRPRPTRLSSLGVNFQYKKIRLKRGDGMAELEDEYTTYHRGKDTNVDILDTLFYHFEIKTLPLKGGDQTPKEKVESEFLAQIRKDRGQQFAPYVEIGRGF